VFISRTKLNKYELMINRYHTHGHTLGLYLCTHQLTVKGKTLTAKSAGKYAFQQIKISFYVHGINGRLGASYFERHTR
jgi:hypothetical protein